jgi:hypothetical protein
VAGTAVGAVAVCVPAFGVMVAYPEIGVEVGQFVTHGVLVAAGVAVDVAVAAGVDVSPF